jgi:hypothetical protein
MKEIFLVVFQNVEGKSLLRYSKGVRDDFHKDTMRNLIKANSNWPVSLEKEGK